MATTIGNYLKYANLQMAAEATRLDEVLAGTLTLKAALEFGNNRSSKFTTVLADQFIADGWTVFAHKADTPTGFSGTLFKNTQTGELALSFRSTEFIDDAVRDSQATGAMEIREFGWAFGQIADMKAWVDSLYSSQKITANQALTVTGYSLGGHLATAFNLIYPGDANNTYTFNGAGVGITANNVSLTTTIATFNELRSADSDLSGIFTDVDVRNMYASLRTVLRGGALVTDSQLTAATTLAQGKNGPNVPEVWGKEAAMLLSALTRIRSIQAEAARIGNPPLSSGDINSPQLVPVNADQVEATNLNYQLAVLRASLNTSSFRTHPVLSGWDAITSRNQWPGGAIPGFYDVFGANGPSGVANSQYHYGTAVPIFIEEQPLYRGSWLGDAWSASSTAETKLLVPGFAVNDFGDSHSLVLLVDSLSVQNMLATLDPSIDFNRLNQVLAAASNATSQQSSGTQGLAEGDVLENVLDALRRLLLGPLVPKTQANMEGGTWAKIGDRNAFYENLRALTQQPAFTTIAGRVTIGVIGSGLVASARNSFSAMASLLALSPVTLTATDTASQTALNAALKGAWGDATYNQWQADRDLAPEQRNLGRENFTDRWISDRAAMLDWILVRNQRDLAGVLTTGSGGATGRTIAEPSNFDDRGSGTQILVGTESQLSQRAHYVFGAATAETIGGFSRADHLYGGGGNDDLSGQGGNDWLEGNADNDSLTGGDDNDTLLGGTGNDTLNGDIGADSLLGGAGDDILAGGLGNDELRGGLGIDTYNFTGAWGGDSIEDEGGQGSIVIDGRGPLGDIANAATKLAPNAWESADKKTTFTLVSIDATHNNLIVSFAAELQLGWITIRNWTNGYLGLTLPDVIAPPATTETLTGDFIKRLNSDGSQYVLNTQTGNYLSDGPLDGTADVIVGSDADEKLEGKFGNDGLAGGAGADLIEGGDGSDLLLGGTGADTIDGGAGADFIFGSAVGTIARPASTDQVPPAPPGVELAQGFSWVAYRADGPPDEPGQQQILYHVQATGTSSLGPSFEVGNVVNVESTGNIIDGGSGNDYIAAGTGADIVHGGADDDDIVGMGDEDILFGDAGADFIIGDGAANPTSFTRPSYTPASEHGSDIIAGGAGNDVLMGQGADDQLYGGADDDWLYGDDNNLLDTPVAVHGSDYLDGGDGADRLEGGGRDDKLFGGIGNDWMAGEAGNDTLYGDGGNDTLLGGEGGDYLDGGGNDDALFGGEGADLLFGDFGQSHTAMLAWQGKDSLYGEAGNDQLVGGGNADMLIGGTGNDTMWGDDVRSKVAVSAHGNDELDGGDGGDGAEQLIGGGQNDTPLGGAGKSALFGDAGINTPEHRRHRRPVPSRSSATVMRLANIKARVESAIA